MKFSFAQTARHTVHSNISSDFFAKLPEVILKNTGWEYTCQERTDGCFLKPTFKNMPYRNSFVPEIHIVASCHDTQTTLHISGQPVKAIRIFAALWFSFVLLIEMILLVGIITSQESIVNGFAPIGVGVFGFLLVELSMRATFHSIVKAIKKECV